MCARYTLSKRQEAILAAFKIQISGEYSPNYNLAPTQEGLVITADEPGIAQPMHFGLIPYWAADTKLNISTLNARTEEVLTKKTYAPLIERHKTCLVLADGFYEWDRKSGKPIPFRFVLKDRELFAFAGLWSQWKSKDGSHVYRSFTIMTTEANKIVGTVHDLKFRMPVILDDYNERLWLDKELSPAALLSLCKPYPDDKMEVYQVGTEVNSTVIKGVINNKPELMLPLNSQ
jgi:putative SOS response-associated peptidase YedK